jgi:RHS repeat-associated protein
VLVDGGTSSAFTYQYDGSGNRVASSEAGVQSNYSYNAFNQLVSMTTAGAQTNYQYDLNGNLLAVSSPTSSVSMKIDARGRIRRIVDWTNNDVLAEYTYTASGERSSAKYDGSQIQFLRDPHVLVQSDGGGAVIRAIVFVPNTSVPIMMWSEGQWYAVHTNATGAPVSLTNSSAQVAWKSVNEPFGAVHSQQWPLAEKPTIPVRLQGQWEEPIQLSGQALYFNNQRYYLPQAGRYTRMDPKLVPAPPSVLGNHLDNYYAYSMSDPLNSADPNGLQNCHEKCKHAGKPGAGGVLGGMGTGGLGGIVGLVGGSRAGGIASLLGSFPGPAASAGDAIFECIKQCNNAWFKQGC